MVTVAKYQYSRTIPFALRNNLRHPRQPYQKSGRKLSVSSVTFQMLMLGTNNHDIPQFFNV